MNKKFSSPQKYYDLMGFDKFTSTNYGREQEKRFKTEVKLLPQSTGSYVRWWMYQLAWLWQSFHHVHEYHIITLYTLNIHNFHFAIIPQ